MLTWEDMVTMSQSHMRVLAIAQTDIILASPNPTRIAIAFSCPAAVPTGLAIDQAANATSATTQTGLSIAAAAGLSNQLFLNLHDHGDMVRHEWHGILRSTTSQITIVETLCYHPDYLKTLGIPPAQYPHM